MLGLISFLLHFLGEMCLSLILLSIVGFLVFKVYPMILGIFWDTKTPLPLIIAKLFAIAVICITCNEIVESIFFY